MKMCVTTFTQYLSEKIEVTENVILKHYPQLSGILLSSAFKDEVIYNNNHRMHYHRDGPKIDGCKLCNEVLFKECDILNKFICFKEYRGDLKIKSKSHQLEFYKRGTCDIFTPYVDFEDLNKMNRQSIDEDDYDSFTVYMDFEDIIKMAHQSIYDNDMCHYYKGTTLFELSFDDDKMNGIYKRIDHNFVIDKNVWDTHKKHYHKDNTKNSYPNCKCCDSVLIEGRELLNNFICFENYTGPLPIESRNHRIVFNLNPDCDYDEFSRYEFIVYYEKETVENMLKSGDIDVEYYEDDFIMRNVNGDTLHYCMKYYEDNND